MAKLDRVWAEGISLVMFGVRIGVPTDRAGLLDRLIHDVPAVWKLSDSQVVDRSYSVVFGEEKPQARVRRFHLLYGDTHNLVRTESLEDLLQIFESDLTAHLGSAAHQFCCVHAGVVGWKQFGIVFPGKSSSGKTTLVKEFLQRGGEYYSDELAIFDTDVLIHPFPRLLGIRQEANEKRARLGAELLGGRPGISPPVRFVIVTEFSPGGRWAPQVSSLGSAALALLSNSLSAQYRPTQTLQTIAKARSRALVVKSPRSEAHEAVNWIITQLDNEAATTRCSRSEIN